MSTGLGDELAWYCPSIDDSPNDISGNGNGGVYQGGMTTVVDTEEGGARAYEFDGVNAHISGIAVVNGEVSYGGWAKATDIASSTLYLVGDGGNKTLRVLSGASPSSVQSIVKSYSPDRVSATGVIQGNTWHHLFTVIRGSSHELWVDGSLAAESALTGTENPITLNYIGRGFGVTDGVGFADDIRLYNRPLTAAEITHLASARGVLGPPPVGLGGEKAWYCPSIDDSPNDISGNRNNGVYQGGMATVADTEEGGTRAYGLDGVDDYTVIDPSPLPDSCTAISYCAWVKSDIDGSGSWKGIVTGSLTSTTSQTMVIQNALGSQAYFRILHYDGSGSRQENLAGSTTVFDSTWHHVVAMWDGTTQSIYVDGVLDASKSLVGGVVSDTDKDGMWLGRYSQGFILGGLDDVRIFDRALTTEEIAHLASARGVLGSPGGVTPSRTFHPLQQGQ